MMKKNTIVLTTQKVATRMIGISLLLVLFAMLASILACEEPSGGGGGSSSPYIDYSQFTLKFNSNYSFGSAPSGIAISPNQMYVYLTESANNSIALLKRQTTVDAVSFESRIKEGDTVASKTIAGLAGASRPFISKDGKYVYVLSDVASSTSDTLAVFARDISTGELDYLEKFTNGASVTALGGLTATIGGLRESKDLVITPNGKLLIVAGSGDSSIAIFSRDDTTGQLTYIGRLIDANSGVDGLQNVSDLAISSDGKFLYTAAKTESGIGLFEIDAIGNVTYKRRYGTTDASGLTGITSIAISSDDQNIYAGGDAATVVVFRRNKVTGELNLDTQISNTTSGVSGLDNFTDIAISEDDKKVYVSISDATGANPVHALAVFDRNTNSGALTFNKVFSPLGFVAPSQVLVSKNGKYIYVVHTNSVATFEYR